MKICLLQILFVMVLALRSILTSIWNLQGNVMERLRNYIFVQRKHLDGDMTEK